MQADSLPQSWISGVLGLEGENLHLQQGLETHAAGTGTRLETGSPLTHVARWMRNQGSVNRHTQALAIDRALCARDARPTSAGKCSHPGCKDTAPLSASVSGQAHQATEPGPLHPSHTDVLSQPKGHPLLPGSLANSALQTSYAHHPRVLHHPLGTHGHAQRFLSSFYNHFLPSRPFPCLRTPGPTRVGAPKRLMTVCL